MKKKFLAAVLAGAITCLATCGSSFATAPTQEDEQTTQTQEDNGLIKLVTAELPDDYVNPMIFVEGVGVVSTDCEDFDSSENSNADEDANKDVNFNGLGYISKNDIKIFQETGELTFSNLKADFDTNGLQWGMFNAENGYIQLVKSSGDEVTERGLYKVDGNEIKKLCDLDTAWTLTDVNGVSVTIKEVEEKAALTYDDNPDKNRDVYYISKIIMVVTQPDSTQQEYEIAKSDDFSHDLHVDKGGNVYDEDYWNSNFCIDNCLWSVSQFDDTVTIAYDKSPICDFLALSMKEEYEIIQINKDGTSRKTIQSDTGDLIRLKSWKYGDIVWEKYQPPMVGSNTFYVYNSKTEDISMSGYDADDRKSYYYYNEIWKLSIVNSMDNNIIAEIYDYRNPTPRGVALFSGIGDLKNYDSKTYYDDLEFVVRDDSLYRILFEKDGKSGIMDLNENVLGTFDNIGWYVDEYALVSNDGKAYLVDEDMNTVSETVDADKISAVSDELFLITKDGKSSFVTFTDKTTSKPSSSSGSSSGSSSNTATIVDYSDDKLGFAATAEVGVLPADAILTVTAINDETTDTQLVYDICFKDIDGKEVQPNGTVTVKIPVPEKFKDAEKVYVYRAETDGTYTDMKAEIKDGFVVFTTNHFSKYIVTTEVLTKTETPAPETPKPTDTTPADTTTNPNTGVAVALIPAILAGAVVIVAAKKRK